MKILSKRELEENKQFFLEEMARGKVFVYPTDTIYGIGCNARVADAIERIRKAKMRDTKPFSVIAPTREWIEAHFRVDMYAREWLKKLPGPYTVVLDVKIPGAVHESTYPETDCVGLRIPDHWFVDFVRDAWTPFVTTSVNRSGETPLQNIQGIPAEMKEFIDYVIDEGTLSGKPSKVVQIKNGEVKILRE